MHKTLGAVLALTLAAPTLAAPALAAACTIAEAQRKSEALQAALNAAVQKDPAKAQQDSAKIQAFMQKYQNETTPSDAACAEIDKLIADIKGP